MEFKDIKTPCYIVNESEYRDSISRLMDSFNSKWNGNCVFGYSVKTNHFPYLMNIAKEYGCYSEVVSKYEYYHAVSCGFSDDLVIFNGPNKMDILEDMLEKECIINLDNSDEVETACNFKKQIKARIGLRINLDLEKYIPGETTVKDEVGRFGISYENGDLFKAIELLRNHGIKLSGFHLHHSTSSRSLKAFHTLSRFACQIAKECNMTDIEYIDIGGGLFGGNYFKNKPSYDEYSDVITNELKTTFDPSSTTLILEPGAAVLATSCDYLTSIINARSIKGTNIVTVDGSCLHINPFMKPKQENPCTIINPARTLNEGETQVIGGSTCMEMDRLYPKDNIYYVDCNSKLLFHCAGAYTMTHNSSFINLPPLVYVNRNGEYELIRDQNINTMSL